MNLESKIQILCDPHDVGDAVPENIIGASTDADREVLESTEANIEYVDISLGSGGDGSKGNPWGSYDLAVTSIESPSGKEYIELTTADDLSVQVVKYPTQVEVGTIADITLDNWINIDLPSNNNAYGVAFGDGRVVVVGQNIGGSGKDSIYSDDNGLTWTAVTVNMSSTGLPTWVVYGETAGKFIAGGNSATVWESADNGETWTSRATGSGYNIDGCCYAEGDELFIGVGQNGIMSSSDGITWTSRYSSTNKYLHRVAHNITTGIYCAVSSGSGNTYTSSNGTSWTENTSKIPSITNQVDNVVSNGVNQFVATGTSETWYTSDPTAVWTKVSIGTYQFNALSYGNGKYIIVSRRDEAYESSNGTSWTTIAPIDTGTAVIYDVEYLERTLFFAVGDSTAGIDGGFRFSEELILQADICGFTLAENAKYNSIDIRACTLSGSKTFFSALIPSLINCKIEDDILIESSGFKCESVFIPADITINGQSATQIVIDNDNNITTYPNIYFQNCTIIGDIIFDNDAGSGYETLIDTIVEGNITADVNIIFQSGNWRGTATNVFRSANRVSKVDPLFIDTTDYELKRKILGYSVNSPLIRKSFYSETSQSLPRDFGCYNIDDSNTESQYQKQIFLTKPEKSDSIIIDITTDAASNVGNDGSVDVYNNPDNQQELITLQYQTIKETEFANIKYLMSLQDTRVRLALDPAIKQVQDDLTTSGAATAGNPTITIVEADIEPGLWIKYNDIIYYIMYALPNYAEAVTLVLDRALEETIADAETLETSDPSGTGEYKFLPQPIKATRPESSDMEFKRGLVMRFIKKLNDL